jgi:disulfide bond formation protein DsbB
MFCEAERFGMFVLCYLCILALLIAVSQVVIAASILLCRLQSALCDDQANHRAWH